jgi:hypothetical protein
MYLYSASTSAGLRNFTRFLTNTNTTTYTNEDLDAAINMYYRSFVQDIIDAMDDWDFQGEVATADLVAGQQEYVFPTDCLKIKRAELTYDGTNWSKVNFLDINEISSATDTTSISRNFTKTEPYADLHDNSLFLYPIPDANSAAGLKIWYEKKATDLSAVTDEPLLVEAYQKGLCYGAAKDYFEKYIEVGKNYNKRNLMASNLNEIREEMKNFYRKKIQDRTYRISGGFVDYGYGTKDEL